MFIELLGYYSVLVSAIMLYCGVFSDVKSTETKEDTISRIIGFFIIFPIFFFVLYNVIYK